MTVVDDILEHYGVKGMRWGVRRSRSSTSRTKYTKPPSKLTDSELQRRVQRMETEKKYNSLNAGDISAGKKFATDVLGTSGRRVATTIATNAGVLVVAAVLNKKFGRNLGTRLTKKVK